MKNGEALIDHNNNKFIHHGRRGRMHLVQKVGKVVPINKIPDPEKLFVDLYNSAYDPLKKKIIQYIWAFRTNAEDADDILQNVFKKLWENKNHLHRISSPENYLFIMAKNNFLNSKRHLARKNNALLEYELHMERLPSTDENMILFKETEIRVNKAISELPTRMKEALKLKIEGYKIDRIAGQMGISHSTAKNQLRSAVKKMQACLVN
jgi:RNA polymerase sigma factor (sigma-70 family)